MDDLTQNEIKIINAFLSEWAETLTRNAVEVPANYTEQGLLAYAKETAIKMEAIKIVTEMISRKKSELTTRQDILLREEREKTEAYQEAEKLKQANVGDNI